MSDVVIVPVTGANNLSAINNNFEVLKDAINDAVVHRSGGNNVMTQAIDMNGSKVLNVFVDQNDPGSLLTVGAADSRYATEAELADVAFSGEYGDLLNTPELVLAAVAFSGEYADVLNPPAIPNSPGDIGAATAAQGALADTAVQPAELAAEVSALESSIAVATFAPVIFEVTGSRVASLADAGSYVRFTFTGAKTYTVAPQANVTWVDSTEIHGRNVGATDLTLAQGAGVTLNVPYGGTLLIPTGGSFTIKRVAADEWDIIGQTVPA
ncbi:hypothetical protein D3C78_593030 [compost metagenome]